MLTREEFNTLLDKYVQDTISPVERSKLLAEITTGNYDELLSQHIWQKLEADNAEGANLAPHRSAEMLHKILSSEKQNSLVIPRISRKHRFTRLAAMAAILVILLVSAYLVKISLQKDRSPAIVFADNLNEKANTSSRPEKIQMEDGSTIILEPGAVIHYPAHFLAGKREVYLDGNAFFQVSKNANRPFFVYNRNIVTHVLGTSFDVRLNKETQQVEVSVRSGRVEVYEREPTEKKGIVKNNGVILLPNQKVTYDEHVRQFFPSLVDVPLPIANGSTDQNLPAENMIFEETPLKTVLAYLEKSYGIEIVVENDSLYKSLFTGDVSQQDLYTRLDIICQSVQATYDVKGTRILVKWNRPADQ